MRVLVGLVKEAPNCGPLPRNFWSIHDLDLGILICFWSPLIQRPGFTSPPEKVLLGRSAIQVEVVFQYVLSVFTCMYILAYTPTSHFLKKAVMTSTTNLLDSSFDTVTVTLHFTNCHLDFDWTVHTKSLHGCLVEIQWRRAYGCISWMQTWIGASCFSMGSALPRCSQRESST